MGPREEMYCEREEGLRFRLTSTEGRRRNGVD